jgi:hypothetical protein
VQFEEELRFEISEEPMYFADATVFWGKVWLRFMGRHTVRWYDYDDNNVLELKKFLKLVDHLDTKI